MSLLIYSIVMCHQKKINERMIKIFAAPLQGYTDAAWRHFHAEIYGGIDSYFTPFLRVEKGAMRSQDIKAINSLLNVNQNLIPQIIFRDINEFEILTDTLLQKGYKYVDLNLGCPFSPQVKHGRGAAVICNETLLRELSERIKKHKEIGFSIKMRLGIDSPDTWRGAIEILNETPLTHITIHPRIAQQQYSGDLYIEQFAELLKISSHSVIFNGDLTSNSEITKRLSQFPSLAGIMIGQGLLKRPSLALEFRNGEEWDENRRIQLLIKFHNKLFEHYKNNLCGDTQILSKIKPFWEYLEDEIGRKTAKAIRKATSLNKYLSAVSMVD